jgi:hypothetical protein
MVWFTVWTLLVLGTLGGAFLLGRDLWRKGGVLLAEVERAGGVAGKIADRADVLAAAAPPRPTHDLLTGRAVHRARLAELRAVRAEQREARRLRHERTVLGWRAYTR